MSYVIDITADSRFPVARARVRSVVAKTLIEHNAEGSIAVSVRVVGDRKMKCLNETYRKVAGTTDVLSFATEELGQTQSSFVYPESEPFPLGDVVISYPRARLQAAERNVLVDDEIDALVAHGVKSLLGKHEE